MHSTTEICRQSDLVPFVFYLGWAWRNGSPQTVQQDQSCAPNRFAFTTTVTLSPYCNRTSPVQKKKKHNQQHPRKHLNPQG